MHIAGPGGVLPFVLVMLAAFPLAHVLMRVLIAPVVLRTVPTPTESSAAADPHTFTLCAYNIAHARGPDKPSWKQEFQTDEPLAVRLARCDAIAAFLQGVDADVVVLNEVDFDCYWSGHIDQARRIALRAGYPYVLEQNNQVINLIFLRIRQGNAVLSRFPITACASLSLPALSKWESRIIGKKDSAICTVELPSGQSFALLPIHLEHRSARTRLAAVPMIEQAARVTGIPAIAAGDFNSEYTRSDVAGTTAIRQLLNGGLFHASCGLDTSQLRPTYPTPAAGKKIDWILTTAGLIIEHEEVLDSELSDHLPLLARVRVVSPAAR